MKYTINHACGCERTVEIFGTNAHGERDKKVAWLESIDCPICKAKAESAANGTEEREMLYSEYKNNFANCTTKPGSYNKASKTIVVYVPAETKPAEETTEATDEEITAEMLEAGAPANIAAKAITMTSAQVGAMLDQMRGNGIAEKSADQFAILAKCRDILLRHKR